MPDVIEVVSDSEEERTRPAAKTLAVIEISSSEDDDQVATARPRPAKPPRHRAIRNIIESDSESEDEAAQNVPPANVIDLTLGDSDDQHPTSGTGKTKTPTRPAVAPRYQSLYSDSEDSDGDVFEDAIDDSILMFDPPKSAKKPIRITPPVAKTPSRGTAPKQRTATPKQTTTSDAQPTTPAPLSTPRGSGKVSKRAQAAAEQKELEEYAQWFFDDLNKTVFGNGLPSDTKLAWNVRLLTTAGRARWHKNRHGEESSQIELATKILTSKGRIRNTLSHEMCHLASWVIDRQPNEGHGQIFKKWGMRVMKAYPGVEITTRHTYEISYKYEWKCTNCSKIYGRHSKSINPDECLCGACKTGSLVPLFTTRTPQKSKNNSSGKMAATQPRDSPLRGPDLCISIPTDDDTSDFLEDLTAAVQGITI